MKKYRIILTSLLLALWILLFLIIQIFFEHNLSIIEQTQLFLYNWEYVASYFNQPGGAALLISRLVIQFYAYPYLGAMLLSAILTLTAFQLYLITRKIAGKQVHVFLYLLPVVLLLFLHLYRNYFLQGTIALNFMLFALYVFLRICVFKWKITYSLLVTPLLFYLAGSVSLLFAVSVLIYELFNDRKKALWYVLPVTEVVIISAGSVYMGIIGEFRFAFLPDMYFHHYLKPNDFLYALWFSIPVIVLISCLLRSKKELKPSTKWIVNGVQFIIIIFIGWIGISKIGFLKNNQLNKLEYLADKQNWDGIVDECSKSVTSYPSLIYLNIALANKGILGDRLFYFDQRGVNGLLPAWNNTFGNAALLTDFHYTVGNIAGAQRYAFEGNVIENNESPRMLKRLVQTYLIYGSYPIAERHIRTLEQTLHYKDWAKQHRKFLYNDEAIDNDPELGAKRKCITDNNFLYDNKDIDYLLTAIARQNPQHTAAINYLGAYYLLSKNLDEFTRLTETYFGTDVLPSLPLAFQEAAMHEHDADKRKEYNISDDVTERFYSFEKGFQEARKNPVVRNKFMQTYANTCWHYFIFK